MAKDTLGMVLESRKDEVSSISEVRLAVEMEVEAMRRGDGLEAGDWKLCEMAAPTAVSEVERAALYVRAHDLNPPRGVGLVEAAKAVDRFIVEQCRALVIDVYGLPDFVPEPEDEDEALEIVIDL